MQATRQAQSAIAELNEERATRNEDPLRFVLALHLGEVAYGNVGVAGRLDFTVTGPAANEAARLAEVCKGLERDVLISDSFAAKAKERFESLGHHSLRGVGANHEVFTFSTSKSDNGASESA